MLRGTGILFQISITLFLVFSIICSTKNLMQMPFFYSIVAMDLCSSYTEVIEIGWKYFTIYYNLSGGQSYPPFEQLGPER